MGSGTVYFIRVSEELAWDMCLVRELNPECCRSDP